MKVLMVGNNPAVKGGMTTVISQLLEHDWEKDNIEMRFLPTYIDKNPILKIMYFVGAYFRIFAEMIVRRPDVMHIHMSYKGSFTRKYMLHKLCRLFRVRDIIHLHGSEFKTWYDSTPKMQPKIRRLLREASAFIVLGDEWNRRIKEIEPKTKTIIVNNTVTIPDERTKWDENTFNVLFLGVLISRKGVSDLLDAIALLKKENALKQAVFNIAGSGDEEVALKEKCSGLKLDEHVKFLGWTDGEKKRKLLKNNQLMVLPSYNEGLPMAVLEAVSYGLPVIATKVGDIPLAVKDDVNGYVVEPGNVEMLKERLKQLLVMNRAEWQNYSDNSRKIAEELFSDKNYYMQIANAYRESE